MKTVDEVVRLAKQTLTRHGQMNPFVLLEGTTGSQVLPLPDLPEQAKLVVLEALGYSLATESQLGELMQLFLVTEGWHSSRTGNHPALRPQHDPQRKESVMVAHYHLALQSQQIVLYDEVRAVDGSLADLVMVDHLTGEKVTVESPPLEANVLGYRRGAADAEAA